MFHRIREKVTKAVEKYFYPHLDKCLKKQSWMVVLLFILSKVAIGLVLHLYSSVVWDMLLLIVSIPIVVVVYRKRCSVGLSFSLGIEFVFLLRLGTLLFLRFLNLVLGIFARPSLFSLFVIAFGLFISYMSFISMIRYFKILKKQQSADHEGALIASDLDSVQSNEEVNEEVTIPQQSLSDAFQQPTVIREFQEKRVPNSFEPKSHLYPSPLPQQQTQQRMVQNFGQEVIDDGRFSNQLAILHDMGFVDRQFNLHILHQHNGNIQAVIQACISRIQ